MNQQLQTEAIEHMEFIDMSFKPESGGKVFDHVTFEFTPGKVHQIVGSRGAGVSCLLQIMAGVLSPTRGAYVINGENVAEMTLSEFRRFQLSIGYGFDSGGLISNTTLLENLLLPMHFHGSHNPSAARSRAQEYMDRFQILKFKAMWPALASYGTRKACLLARAFLLNPQCLILDEPTQGLGQDGIRRLVATIQMHQENYGLRHVFLGTRDENLLSFFKDVIQVRVDQGHLLRDVKNAG